MFGKFPHSEARLRQLIRQRDELEQAMQEQQSITARMAWENTTEEIAELEYLLLVAVVYRYVQVGLPLLFLLLMIGGLWWLR